DCTSYELNDVSVSYDSDGLSGMSGLRYSFDYLEDVLEDVTLPLRCNHRGGKRCPPPRFDHWAGGRLCSERTGVGNAANLEQRGGHPMAALLPDERRAAGDALR